VVWLTILGAFANPIFLPLTAALVNTVGWRDTIRVLAAIAATVFLATAASGRGGSRVEHSAVRRTSVPDALRADPRQPRPNAAARPPEPLGSDRSAVERGDRSRVELLDKLVHAAGDVVARCADLVDRPALGIG
jgi:hypothetical protein